MAYLLLLCSALCNALRIRGVQEGAVAKVGENCTLDEGHMTSGGPSPMLRRRCSLRPRSSRIGSVAPWRSHSTTWRGSVLPVAPNGRSAN